MDDTPRTEHREPPAGPAELKTGNWLAWALGLLVVVFLGAFVWQFYEAHTTRGELSEVEQELVMERLKVHLGQAALSAQTRNYEAARRQMSTFFTRLQDDAPAMPPGVQRVAQNFLAMRDDVITGLSRGNPEYAGVLYGMLDSFSTAVDESLGAGTGNGMPTGGGAPDTGATGQPDAR